MKNKNNKGQSKKVVKNNNNSFFDLVMNDYSSKGITGISAKRIAAKLIQAFMIAVFLIILFFILGYIKSKVNFDTKYNVFYFFNLIFIFIFFLQQAIDTFYNKKPFDARMFIVMIGAAIITTIISIVFFRDTFVYWETRSHFAILVSICSAIYLLVSFLLMMFINSLFEKVFKHKSLKR